MEQERLRQAFGIKTEQNPNTEAEGISPEALALARRAVGGKEMVDITPQLKEIEADINSGRRGAARGKVESLINSLEQNNLYPNDYKTLNKYYDMVK